jgi:hypothetical protein
MVEVLGNGVPGAIGQGRRALLPGLEVARVNGTGKICHGFGSGSQRELDGSGCLSAVAGCLEHKIDSLWSSVLRV